MRALASDSKGRLCGLCASVVHFRFPLLRTSTVFTLLALAACGGGGDGGGTAADEIGTLAYVNTTCRDDPAGFTLTQELRVQRGDAAPITVARFGPLGPLPAIGACTYFASFGAGSVRSPQIGAFQRLGVSPDGTGIVFEVSDDFNVFSQTFVPPEQEGIFVVRADGSGLRRLDRASRAAASTPNRIESNFVFSPNGRLVGFTDTGPGQPDGQDAAQIFTLDIETGQRTQVTHLPPAPVGGIEGTNFEDFVDDHTILFNTSANPDDGLNPDHIPALASIGADGNGKPTVLPYIALPNGALVPNFAITGARRSVGAFSVPGTPVNPGPAGDTIGEVFINDDTNVLQLTDFRRTDTSFSHPLLAVDGERVFFVASVDLGANPMQACQIFSVDALGGDYRQLTHITLRQLSHGGCAADQPADHCRIRFNRRSQDGRNGLLVFNSSCDPLATQVDGDQLFVMRPDGNGLRQLTNGRGVVRNVVDHSFEAELPGPWAYGPYRF